MRKALLGIFMLAATVALGQGSIEGKVFEEGSNEPLMFANVSVDIGGVTKGATTDERGKFRIKPLDPGTYNVKISFVGMGTRTVKGVRVQKDDITRIEDVFMSVGEELTGIDIIYVKPVIDFASPGKMTLKGAELMETSLSRDPVGFVASLGDGIVQQDQGQPLYIRGGRADAVKYVIDGMNVDGISIPSRGIGEIAVYTSGIPAKYGDVLSGVIVVETKSYFDLYNQYNN